MDTAAACTLAKMKETQPGAANAPRAGEDAYVAVLRRYRSLDPISQRLLVDAVEAKARRMRAQAIRELLRAVAGWAYASIARVAAAAQSSSRRERLAASAAKS